MNFQRMTVQNPVVIIQKRKSALQDENHQLLDKEKDLKNEVTLEKLKNARLIGELKEKSKIAEQLQQSNDQLNQQLAIKKSNNARLKDELNERLQMVEHLVAEQLENTETINELNQTLSDHEQLLIEKNTELDEVRNELTELKETWNLWERFFERTQFEQPELVDQLKRLQSNRIRRPKQRSERQFERQCIHDHTRRISSFDVFIKELRDNGW